MGEEPNHPETAQMRRNKQVHLVFFVFGPRVAMKWHACPPSQAQFSAVTTVLLLLLTPMGPMARGRPRGPVMAPGYLVDQRN